MMKKMIVAFDGLKFSESARDYAIELAKQANAHLVGVFLDDASYTSYKTFDLVAREGISEIDLQKLVEKDKLIRRTAKENFENTCKIAGIDYNIHHDRNIAIQELKHESIYADLLIIASKETLTPNGERLPTRFISDLLSDVQCPVLLVPQKFYPIDQVVLLYDGEPSSVMAVKMFSYVLPHLKRLQTAVVSVNPINDTLHLPDNRLMKEFMNRHYPDAKYNVLKGWAHDEIVKQLKETTGNPVVILGAYTRGALSRWFKESMADVLMREVNFPLFIAHNF